MTLCIVGHDSGVDASMNNNGDQKVVNFVKVCTAGVNITESYIKQELS